MPNVKHWTHGDSSYSSMYDTRPRDPARRVYIARIAVHKESCILQMHAN